MLEAPAEGRVVLLDQTAPGLQGWLLALGVGAAALLFLLLGFRWRRRSKKTAAARD